MDKISLIARMRLPVVRQRVMAAIIPVIFVFIFVSIVIFLRAFKPEAAGFEQTGWLLLSYNAARLGLMFYIAFLCYSVGYRALELFRGNPQGLFNSARKTFILCFFFGATLYGIAFAALGLAGLISLASGFALTIPALLFSYQPLKRLLPERFGPAIFRSFVDTHASSFFVWAVILAAIAAIFLFLITRAVFIPNIDGNIWEHYLHYYRAVLISGSTQPNEVWHHFYNSKGGGLVFLANILSDYFGVQLVSACFVGVAGLIILDLLIKYCRSISWAVFGVMLFFIYLAGNVSDGGMFRVHGVILGYASFAFWGSVWLQQAMPSQRKALMVVLVVSLAYFGFYFPVANAIFPAAFLLFALTNVVLHDKVFGYSFLTLSFAVSAGTALVMVVNWILTGLPEVTPMRWFWEIADRAKVEEVFGTGGIEFFLAVNNDLKSQERWFALVKSTIRYPVPIAMMWLVLLSAFVVLMRMLNRYFANGTIARPDKFLVQLIAFVIPLCALAIVVQSPSIYRMGLYSVVFTTLATVVIWKRLVDISFGRLWISLKSVESDRGGISFHPKFRLWRGATVAIIFFAMSTAFVMATKNAKGQWPLISRYARGVMSLKDVFQSMEFRQGKSSGTSVAAMANFRKTNAPEGKILSLSYDTGYAYFLPGEGIVSEPTYSLINNPKKILADKPKNVADYLQERNIRYFALNLQARLFSTVAFTSLFDVHEMPKYFSVAYEDGDFFILKWRQSDLEKPLPDYLLTLVDLKRTGVLHYSFTERFATRVTTGDNLLVTTIAEFENVRDAFLENLDREFSAEMLSSITLETSRTRLRRVLNAGKDRVKNADAGTVLEVRRGLSNQLNIRSSEQKIRARLVSLFRDALYEEYVPEFGSEIASLFRRCDERFPFAIDHPRDAKC